MTHWVNLGGSAPTGPPVAVGIPDNSMILWNGNISSPPTGWTVCSGFAGKFLVIAGDGYSMGATGGNNNIAGHALTIREIPSHSHTYKDKLRGTSLGSGPVPTDHGTSTKSTSRVGGGQAHSHGDNRPPYKAVALLCKISQ